MEAHAVLPCNDGAADDDDAVEPDTCCCCCCRTRMVVAVDTILRLPMAIPCNWQSLLGDRSDEDAASCYCCRVGAVGREACCADAVVDTYTHWRSLSRLRSFCLSSSSLQQLYWAQRRDDRSAWSSSSFQRR